MLSDELNYLADEFFRHVKPGVTAVTLTDDTVRALAFCIADLGSRVRALESQTVRGAARLTAEEMPPGVISFERERQRRQS